MYPWSSISLNINLSKMLWCGTAHGWRRGGIRFGSQFINCLLKTVEFGGIFSVKVWINIIGCYSGVRRVLVGVKKICDILNFGGMHVQKHLSRCSYVGLIFRSSILELFIYFLQVLEHDVGCLDRALDNKGRVM